MAVFLSEEWIAELARVGAEMPAADGVSMSAFKYTGKLAMRWNFDAAGPPLGG